ncbi:uncharacterized protein L3040_006936 [Drepanopeziza brunnea f. sp. 'multigermtubi']|uniref:Mus7/MMS22 family protein n=1 Tax=Marssonina brunnea f. sp. multigermtubi (strain MB_m1) TaxID=1072389 RepID=K1XK29_MARBU|nr:Mus7/MMS22 family protein [Drepanopeziza brunnea f. sp. 'multigermtubi' MB_m1]EKD12784.1 Mus7/MMS22 family protein [Drepanopeziza brunnea f. sp. 'multigermtubi' MB_m1]KAJ5038065.1 hypothetical protein L3040_006936 [Drepanopeziza brunnea f. sp. 'multigermtubi']
MATWKEKGVVPDSDDEDGLDSQSTTGSESPNNEPRFDDAVELDGNAGATAREDGDGDGVSKFSGAAGLEVIPREPDVATEQGLFPGAAEDVVENLFEQLVEGGADFPEPTPSFPMGNKGLRLFSDLDRDDNPQAKDGVSLSQSGNGVPAEDEISRSYVQITSPISTTLSSPLSSPLSFHTSSEPTLPIIRREQSMSPCPQPEVPEVVQLGIENDPSKPLQEVPASTARRSLRQRNAIQLHPYLVEQEKYRKTLKAGGIAPVRMESSPEDSRRPHQLSSSPGLESQEQDSQSTFFDLGERQHNDMDWDPTTSSPVRPEEMPPDDEVMNDALSGANDDEDDEEEEFPALNKLLKGPSRFPKKSEPKQRLKTYGTKFKRPLPSENQIQPPTPVLSNTSAMRIFDIPASPPATSSPFAAASRRGRAPLSRAGSNSIEPTRSIARVDDAFLQTNDLPTPATSSVKNVQVMIDSDVESDDPFASDVEKSLSPSSSSNESEKIRRKSRKIRGVLPASYLRLDQAKRSKPSIETHRDYASISPVKDPSRRGVALPRMRQHAKTSSTSADAGLAFLSDSEDDENEPISFATEVDSLELETIFDQSRLGFALEDDTIDAMLPSKKRTSRGSTQMRKRRKIGSGLGARTECRAYNKSERITDYLRKPGSMRQSKSSGSKSARKKNDLQRPRKPAAPRLSILDVMDDVNRGDSSLPDFIKIAARTARSRVGQGRHSPSRKFIRLANRADTQEAQSVLQDWKQGKLSRKPRKPQSSTPSVAQRSALQEITNNAQGRLPTPVGRNVLDGHHSMSKRKFVVSRRQQSMNDFVRRDQAAPQEVAYPRSHSISSRNAIKPQGRYLPARPAQLESTGFRYSDPFDDASFKRRKRTLDALYRNTLKRRVPQINLQLSRFLADDDVVRPSVEKFPDQDTAGAEADELKEVGVVRLPKKSSRRRKQSPHRIDAGAANYRQPTDPLILDFFTPIDEPNDDNSKLLGLGKFGTSYPYHFDILPLQPGIFFHASTLIGGHRLADALHDKSPTALAPSRSSIPSLKFADKILTWTTWDEQVSSEVGVCFDWLLDRFQAQQTSSPPTADAIEVVIFILDYVQFNVRFDGTLDREDFVSRMIEVLQDFSNRFDAKKTFQQAQIRLTVEVLSTCILIVLRLLNSIRTQSVANISSYFVEDLLKSVSGHCIDLLLSQGLEPVRKLYDDLQYLSFRERGIKGDQHAVNAWVILIKVLGAAEIPKGSFWELANARLLNNPMHRVIDAPSMEKLWYAMYTLLPLCEFDEFGVVVPGLRHTSKFDNWYLPQQILKRIFSLYKSNERQAPGFNEYCRALFHRCHYLMTQWGWWKCHPIIGALFDFFASHNLAHLRNEEVYKSPHFLEQLDAEPSLAIEAEDRCFHIFLKIIALGIQHLSKAGDVKSIRNLVARLLPNHDRQFPKEETIHHRDLSALRNHHDILSTLFWASPPAQRPSLSLIQELVIAERSHNEACLINIRAWENLSLFIVTKNLDNEAYKPFTIWQSAFFSSLCQQYLDAEQDLRQQAELLEKSSGQAMSESKIVKTVLMNRRSIMIPMCTSIRAMANAIKAARSSNLAREALNCDVFSRALDAAVHTNGTLSKPLLDECSVALCKYMDQIKLFHPPAAHDIVVAGNGEADSQDSLDILGGWERLEMILPLRHNVLDKLCPLVRRYLESEIEGGQDRAMMTRLVTCWARVISLVSEGGGIPLESFLTRGQYAVFENRRTCKIAELYWPLFLASLLIHGKTLSDLQLPSFIIGLEWLLSLINCQAIPDHVKAFTLELRKIGHYLTELVDLDRLDQTHMVRAAIRKMSSVLIEDVTEAKVGLPIKQAHRLFSDMLGEMMKSMQRLLESLEPGTDLHNYHLQVARSIVSDIRSYASDFSTVPEFFLKESTHYWPHYDDPSMYGAGLISYCLRLAHQPDKTTMGLFYYLLNGWKSSMISNRMRGYISCIRKGMKWWDFTKFMLSDLVPALIATGFQFSGWLICSTFLPAISNQVTRLLSNAGSKSEWVFENLLNILKMTMNGTITFAHQQGYNVNGVHPDHRGILAVVYKFWLAIALPMREYATRHSQEEALEEVSDPLSSFVYNALHAFHARGEQIIPYPAGQFDVHPGKYTDKFVDAVAQEIKETWDFQDQQGFEVVVRGRGSERSAVQVFGEGLGRVLDVDVERYECAFPDKEELVLRPKRNMYLENMYF